VKAETDRKTAVAAVAASAAETQKEASQRVGEMEKIRSREVQEHQQSMARIERLRVRGKDTGDESLLEHALNLQREELARHKEVMEKLETLAKQMSE